MTEKRFTTDNGSNEDVCLVDNLTGKEYEDNFDDVVDLLNQLWKQTQRFEKHNQRLEHDNQVLIQFKNITIKTLQGVKDNHENNSYTSALMDSIANELGVDLE